VEGNKLGKKKNFREQAEAVQVELKLEQDAG
jgi:hypothetical protein